MWKLIFAGGVAAMVACGEMRDIPDAAPAPEVTFQSTPPPLTNSPAASFTFTATVDGSSFDCQLDGGAVPDCASPLAVAVAEGAHTLIVTAVGPSDARSAAASVTWVVDLTPPQTVIVSGPNDYAASTTAKFVFGPDEPNIQFVCSLDGAADAPCPADATFPGLSEATHTLDVRATDAAGNADASRAEATWTVDVTAPAAPVLTVSPAGPANDNTPELDVVAEVGTVATIYAGSGCTGAAVVSNVPAGGSTIVTVDDNSTTSWSAAVTDRAGNRSPCSIAATFVEDSRQPAVPSLSLSQPSPANNNAPIVTVTAEPGTTTNLWRGSTCTGSPLVTNLAPGASTTLGVPDNSINSWVAQSRKTSSGLDSACSAPIIYVEDSIPPSLPTLAFSPASPSSRTTTNLLLSGERGSQIVVYRGAGCLTRAVGTYLAGSRVPMTVTANSTTIFSILAVDAAGNRSACSPNYSYICDTTAPVVSNLVAPSGGRDGTTVTFSVTDNLSTWNAYCSLDGGTAARCMSKQFFSASTGAHTMTVYAIDAAGNRSTAVVARFVVVPF